MLNLKPDWNEGLLITFGLTIGLILGGVFFSGAAYSNPPSPSRGEHGSPVQNPSTDSNRNGQNQGPRIPQPFVVRTIATPEDQAAADRDAAYQQAHATDKHMLEVGIGAIIIGAVQASFLLWTLWETRKTSRRQLRVYVMVEKVTLSDFEQGKSPSVAIVIKNFGQTPATNVSVKGQIIYSEHPIPSAIPGIAHNKFSSSAVAPGDVFGSRDTADFIVSGEKWLEIGKGTHAIYIYGSIKYADAFGRCHETLYRYFTHGKGMIYGEMAAAEEGNELKELECEDRAHLARSP